MSKNLNNFWDDCLDEQDLETNLFINSKNISSNRTKPSTSSKNNSEVIFISGAKYKSNNNLKKKINLRNSNPFNQKKQINRTKEFYEKWPFFKDLTTTKQPNKNIGNNIKRYTLGRNKSKSKVNFKSKSKTNNISSDEIILKKNLSECTFHPKIISQVKNRYLKEKLLNYSKFTMYERGQIFQMKKKEDGNRMYIEQYKKRNKKYSFKPEIHKCPSFRNVVFNDSNYESLNYFYSRMNSAREIKINKNKKLPFSIINYDEIYKNNSDYLSRSVYHRDSNSCEISFIMPKKNSNNKIIKRIYSRPTLMAKILNDKETEICKQNLHKALMNLELNKK